MLNTYIDKVINSPVFAKSKRQRELLAYLVQQMIDGNGSRIKGYVIALEVFKRGDNFDPAKDSIVRVEAGRLRNKLRRYYETYGPNDPVEITLPKGTYAIQVIERDHARNSVGHQFKKPNLMLDPLKLIIMPFLPIDLSAQDEHLVAEIADLVIFELVELDIIQVTSSNLALVFNSPSSLSGNQTVLLDAHYMLEASVQKIDGTLILMARMYSHLADAYVWHNRFSFNSENKKVAVQIIGDAVNKFFVDEISSINVDLFDSKCNEIFPLNYDLFDLKDHLRSKVHQ